MTAWRSAPLGQVCKPKQWPILARSQFTQTGYPVYGANGRIGYASKFTHRDRTVLVGCRGSCGNVHVSAPMSYVNGNAMALDELDTDRVDRTFLAAFLAHRGLRDVTTGSSQPQITRQNLVRVEVPLPPIEEQRRIAAILAEADALRAKRREVLTLNDDLTKSIFLDMFGDPVSNPRRWPTRPLSKWGVIVTGNTPSRAIRDNYGPGIEWIKSDNIDATRLHPRRASETLSQLGARSARVAPVGSILIVCIAGSPASIGRAAMLDRDAAFNQQINALIPKVGDVRFMLSQLRVSPTLVQARSTGGMKGLVSKGRLAGAELLDPPLSRQREFASRAAAIDSLRDSFDDAAMQSDRLFSSLQARAFSGRL